MIRDILILGGPRNLQNIQVSEQEFKERLVYVADSEENPTKYVACDIDPVREGGWVAIWPNPYTYMVFESHNYYPRGGWKDFKSAHKSIADARNSIRTHSEGEYYEGFDGTAHIVRFDSDKGEFELQEEYNIHYTDSQLKVSVA